MTSGAGDFVSTTAWMQSGTTNTNTSSPPPAYAVLPPDHEQPAAASSIYPVTPPCRYASTPNPHPIPNPAHPHFGPTPLSSQYPLLPYAYYDSPGVVEGRARCRFVGALMCGIGVCVVIGGVMDIFFT